MNPSFYVDLFIVNCVAPYVRSPSGTCVDTQTDVENCGSIGYVCSSNYRSCTAGQCSTAPGVELKEKTVVWSGLTQGNIDDVTFEVNLPLNITLYGTTRSLVTVTTNGVSFLLRKINICLYAIWLQTVK